MSNLDIFTGELLPDPEIDTILAIEIDCQTNFSITDRADYLADRRRLLGRIANIQHPAFGSPNLPEEDYTVLYKIIANELDWPDPLQIDELIYDYKGVLVATQQL